MASSRSRSLLIAVTSGPAWRRTTPKKIANIASTRRQAAVMDGDSSIAYARKNDHGGRCFHTVQEKRGAIVQRSPRTRSIGNAAVTAFAWWRSAPVECMLAIKRHHADHRPRIITVTFLVAPLLAHLARAGDHVVPCPLALPHADAARPPARPGVERHRRPPPPHRRGKPPPVPAGIGRARARRAAAPPSRSGRHRHHRDGDELVYSHRAAAAAGRGTRPRTPARRARAGPRRLHADGPFLLFRIDCTSARAARAAPRHLSRTLIPPLSTLPGARAPRSLRRHHRPHRSARHVPRAQSQRCAVVRARPELPRQTQRLRAVLRRAGLHHHRHLAPRRHLRRAGDPGAGRAPRWRPGLPDYPAGTARR